MMVLQVFDMPVGGCRNGRMVLRLTFLRFRHHGGSLQAGY